MAAALSSQSLALCHHAAREMRAMGKTISFDPNLRPVLWPSREVLPEKVVGFVPLGSAFLVQIARREWFFDFYDPRLYAMVVGQAPIMTAIFNASPYMAPAS